MAKISGFGSVLPIVLFVTTGYAIWMIARLEPRNNLLVEQYLDLVTLGRDPIRGYLPMPHLCQYTHHIHPFAHRGYHPVRGGE